ncbi:MAG: septal ring lytic transglycosylase RlpA family protein [Hyphomicrobiales bacterium]|nr:septal ring lytic transglycosylase RlpA family protein [Hyphomicrobiales bacterium]
MLVAMTLSACNQSEVSSPSGAGTTAASSRSQEHPQTFSSFPDWYFASATFSSAVPLAAMNMAAANDTPPALRLASVSSTLAPEPPPLRRSIDPGHPSYGLASFYRHHSRTASGEAFNERELTAAHRTLPFGTRVRVTSLATGRSVTVRVNDRGPYVQGRVVDLSYSAAEALGMVGRGVTRVKLDVVQ